MIAKIKLYLRRTVVLLLNMIAWWAFSGVIVAGVGTFTMIPLLLGASLSDELLFGTDIYSSLSSFYDWLLSPNVFASIMIFFALLGGIYELFYPKSSTRTTTLDKWGLDWKNN